MNLTNMAARFARDACVLRRLDEIDALLDQAEVGGPFAPPRAIGGPRERSISTARWETAKSGGRLSLISSEEQRAFARAYAPLERVKELQELELQTWMRLHALQGRRRLTPDMITAQRLAVAEARDLNELIRQGFGQGRFYADKVGVEADAHLQLPPSEATGGPTVCQPLGALAPPSPGAR